MSEYLLCYTRLCNKMIITYEIKFFDIIDKIFSFISKLQSHQYFTMIINILYILFFSILYVSNIINLEKEKSE